MNYAKFDLLILVVFQVPPWFLANNNHCWEMVVKKWFTEGWVEKHEAGREHRLRMPGVPHHQGNRNLKGYAKKWVRVLVSLFQRSVLHNF